jgi:hypothetical protein
LPHGFRLTHYKSGDSIAYSADSPFQSTDHMSFRNRGDSGELVSWFISDRDHRLADRLEDKLQTLLTQPQPK